jgi:ribosome-associated protein
VRKKSQNVLGGKELVDAIVKQAQESLAENIVVIDLRDVAGSTDWFIICQGDTSVHNQAIFSGIVDGMIECGTRPWKQEGEEDGRWVLIDFSDVVVHVMLPELRQYYDLESLWPEAKRVEIPVTR